MTNLLDRQNNKAIILAGIISIVISIGVARFAFTSILPMMLDDGLELTFAGILTSINYIGYLSGALVSVFLKSNREKEKYFKIGLVIAGITALMLGLTENKTIWLISRLLAGFGSGMCFVIAGAIVMNKLKFDDKTKAMGIHYSGIGFSIVISELIVMAVISFDGDWKISWIILGIFAFIASIYSMHILSFDKKTNDKTIEHKFDKSIFTPFVLLIIFAYFTEGVGFVVQGTFLPDIINSIDGLKGYGNSIWALLGLFGIPSCIIWLRLAHKYGSINIIIIASLLEIISILIPAISTNIWLNILGSIMYGSTVLGIIGLFMNLGGKIAKNHPVFLMGSFTVAYAIGQITAPLYSVLLADIYKSYDYALLLTASIVGIGVIILFLAKRISPDKTL